MPEKHMRCDELWINLLPSLRDKDVVKFGTARTRTIHNLAAYSPRSLMLVGNLSNRSSAAVVQYMEISNVPTRTYDVLIADEPEFVANCVLNLGATVFVTHLARILKDNGILVILAPDLTFWTIRTRYSLLRALRQTFGRRVTYFVCEPSSSDIQTLESLQGAIRSAVAKAWRNLGREFGRTLISSAKSLAKALLLRATGSFNICGGLLIIARGESEDDAPMSITQELIIESGIAPSSNRLAAFPHVAYQYRGPRHLLLIRDGHNDELLHVGKLDIVDSGNQWGGEQECKNLHLISLCKEELALHKVQFPAVICSRVSGQRHEVILSAVRGVSLELLVADAITGRDYSRLCKIIDSVASIQRTIQSCLSAQLIQKARHVPSYYFEDYLRLGLDWTLEGAQVFSQCVQHGDFTANNMLYDPQSHYWGIIDWEAMSCGYPVLFDWFSFLTSLKLTGEKKPCAHTTKAYYDSFITTYFRENEFTEHLRALTVQRCQVFSVDPSLTRKYLTAFLVFNCNRIRMAKFRPDYQALWEEVLIFTADRRNRFTLVR